MVWIFPLDKRCDFVNFYRTQITIFHWLKGGQNIYIDVNIHILEYIFIYIYIYIKDLWLIWYIKCYLCVY